MIPQLSQYEILKRLLKDANYDEAFRKISDWDLRAVTAPDLRGKLHLACMIADVLDYAGLYGDAKLHIQKFGELAAVRLKKIHSAIDITDPYFLKQECWAVMMWGMCLYRSFEYEDSDTGTGARTLFERAKKVAEMIHSSGTSCLGTLARAWYCIGLIEREEHNYSKARTAFRNAIELTAKGIQLRHDAGANKRSYEYHMARCCGLGVGWIAYNEALLTEAVGELSLARCLMLSKHATFISGYIDLVHASVMMSESTELTCIEDALHLLNKAHSIFAPPKGPGHTAYRLRAENELALAYLRRSRAQVDDQKRGEDIKEAERYVNQVKSATEKSKGSARTYCAALITEARIRREQADPKGALALAQEAKNIGGHATFTLIDACIGVGEAAFEDGDYRTAIAEFEEARSAGRNSRKIGAVCHLHLCRTYMANNQPAKAIEHFKTWKLLASGLQNAFITALADRVRKSIAHVFEEFRLSKDDVIPDLPYNTYLNWLRKWLATTAIALEGDDLARAATRIGIGIERLKQWKEFPNKDE